MFTGIVEEKGRVRSCTDGRVTFGASAVLQDAAIGDSIAVDGCCLTVVEVGDGWWSADLSEETRRRTTFETLAVDDPVNMERPLRLDERLGGHLVQGHVDAVGEIVQAAPDLRVRIPASLIRFIAEKGSVAVDGVSLTVVDVFDDRFSVAVIPHTMEVTTLGEKQSGDSVNVEIDLIAKYVERLMAPMRP